MPSADKQPLVFFVNGHKVVDNEVDPETTLLQYLRTKLRLCGTKLGCGEGGCGACTVMVSKYNRTKKKIEHMSVNACLAPVCSMHGLAVTTVEGIGSMKTKLHPVQERIYKSHGSQCGFCTPGIVMSMYTLLRSNMEPTMEDMEVTFQGNLCRCTGYRPIIEGFRSFTKDGCCGGRREGCCMNGSEMNGGESNGCCKNGGESNGCCKNGEANGDNIDESTELFKSSEFAPYDPSQEPIFPPELQLSDEYDKQSLKFDGKRVTWHRPTNLKELLDLKARYPDAKLVVGNTEVGVEVKFKNFLYPVIISPNGISEMTDVKYETDGLTFGASTTLSTIEEVMRQVIAKEPEFKTRVFAAVVEMFRWFAGRQIRNVSAVGGNIATASPISDLNPLLMACGAQLKLASKDGVRTVVMDKNFFLGYRKTAIKPEEIILSVTFPYTNKNEYFFGFKQAKRRDDDIAIVNAGLCVSFQENSNVIQNIRMAFGGMAPFTVMATKTMEKLKGMRWEDSMIADACKLLAEDLPLSPSAPGGMIEFRRTLTTSFFFKFYMKVLIELEKSQPESLTSKIPESYRSVCPEFHRDIPKSTQIYQVVAPGQRSDDPVGRPVPHTSAAFQASGEAVYLDDMPRLEGELYLAAIVSSKAHAKILSIDASKALEMEGVVDFICSKDIPGDNTAGVIHDEEIFATTKVTCQGQFVGAIVAENQAIAQRAAKLVRIEYEDISPVILTIQDAIKHNSFIDNFTRSIKVGDVDVGFSQSDHVITGEIHMGGQEHFYLETNCSLAVPKGEHGEIEIFSSSQNPTETQKLAADALGIPANRVVAKVKRMGGGFGGKETRCTILSTIVAVAAQKLQRPVRCMLDRDEDMVITGTRHPFYGKYKVGFSKKGEIQAIHLRIYSNGGNTLDLSGGVMDRAMLHADNTYRIPNMDIKGRICRTNLASNTAFRGFGGPQGMLITESLVDEIARKLGSDPAEIREINLYKEGELTHFQQPLINCTIEKCWKQVKLQSNYYHRRKCVDQFNRENRWKKRGLALTPVKFGIAFTVPFLNQAGALVHVYTDGSVLLTHGGTEMGQGLHTKMIQVASRVLRIPSTMIHISETSTDKVPNTSPSAASASSDLNGMAVLNACQTIMERLEPYIANNPKGTWKDWVKTAYLDRVSLSSTGFYKTPDVGYDFTTNSGNPFNYFCYGAACSEVEIDCLTGDHQVLKTDITMDVGESLNPAIDIGQVEGAFMQGYGLYTLEEHRYSPTGFLFTRGPGMYKIPGFADIPVEFNVALLKGAPNPRAVFSSKAVGEPPLFLAASVFFAIKDAILSARKEVGVTESFRFDSPATAERIRMGCTDQFTQQFPSAEPGSFQPWSVIV